MRSSVRIVSRVSLLGALAMNACMGPAKPAIEHPMVRFRAPPGLVMFLTGSQGALKVTFTGNVGPAPFVCQSKPWLVDTSGDPASLRAFMRRLATKPGSKRVALYDRRGKLVATGALCIFPTYKTNAKAIKEHYTIRIPRKALERLLRHAGPVALFESYPPSQPSKGLVHIAWALYLFPS